MRRHRNNYARRGARVGLARALGLVLATAPFPVALAGVGLRLEAEQASAGVGAELRVALVLYAVDGVNESVSGLDAILRWDPAALRLEGQASNAAIPWLLVGLPPDSAADGLNDSFDDGDALFQGIGSFQSPIVVPVAGVLVTTLTFEAQSAAGVTELELLETFGQFSRTQVLRFGADAVNILEDRGAAEVLVVESARLRVPEAWLPSGRWSSVLLTGELAGAPSNGVSAILGITPAKGGNGSVAFTPAPPADVVQAGDPWPESGGFLPIEIETAGQGMLNGCENDAGMDEGVPVDFAGPLAWFPIEASSDAAGTWDVMFTEHGIRNGWSGVATALITGRVHIVELGDGDGDGVLGLLDASELSACLKGPEGPVFPPAYSWRPEMRCGVYDMDDDGDVDLADHAAFAVEHSARGE